MSEKHLSRVDALLMAWLKESGQEDAVISNPQRPPRPASWGGVRHAAAAAAAAADAPAAAAAGAAAGAAPVPPPRPSPPPGAPPGAGVAAAAGDDRQLRGQPTQAAAAPSDGA
eukprot:467027-Pyramimonas_sp.AAC.1